MDIIHYPVSRSEYESRVIHCEGISHIKCAIISYGTISIINTNL